MRPLLPGLGAVLCAVALSAGSDRPVAAQEPARRDTLEDAPLTLVYRPYVRAIVTALQWRGSFYLPLGEVLTQLGIDHRVDPQRATASGRYLGKHAEYRIDFQAGRAAVGERTHTLDRESFLIADLDIFVLPSVLEQFFGLRSTVDSHMLSVEITSAEELPVAESFRRRERHALLAATSPSSVAPLRYARQRRVLDGGVLQYAVVGESADDSDVFRFDIMGGGELLGGDFQGALHGSLGGGARALYQHDWRWHYVVGDARGVSQLTLGRFYSNGLQPRTLEGLEITNRPVELRARLGAYTIDGVAEPNAEVELYLNDRLAGVGRADAFGQHRFTLPVSYGTSILRIQSYDASGGVRREERALQIPFAFLPRGRADYEVEAGRAWQTGAPAAHGRIAIGVSRSLTSSLAIDYDGSASARNWVPYGGVSARLGSGHIVALDVAPRVLYRASWEGAFPSRANVGATVTRFASKSWLNEASAAYEWSIHGYAPLGPRAAGGMLQGNARLRRSEDGSRTWLVRTTAAAQLGPVRPLVGYDWLHVRSATGGVGVDRRDIRVGAFAHPLRRTGVPRSLRAMLVSGSQTYDLVAHEPRQIQLNLSTHIARSGWLEASFHRDYLTRTNRVDLHLVLEHGVARSTTSMSRQGDARRLTQSLSGTIAYDARSRALVLSDRNWVGQSGAVMRFFLDRNGNARLDAGEEPVSGATIRLDRAARLEPAGPGVVRATDLPAYQRITANVDVSGVRNPLWMPKAHQFAFITDPNRYKAIDIPFFVAGVVEGTVVRRVGAEERPVAGLKLRLRRVDMDFQIDLPTFSDGTFYHMGVPPGQYTLEPDVTQLELLGVTAEPATRSFEVRESSSGDVVERLDFVLVPAIRSPSPR